LLSFLFLLTAGPRTEAVHTVRALAVAAGESGHRVEVFLAGDGVAHAGTLAGSFPVTLCDADLRWRQAQPSEIPGVHRGSLRDLARQCREADRILVFR
jgi:sulfur relay (sulfurtransferase) complex TusBCD TusD component (DsrE family)